MSSSVFFMYLCALDVCPRSVSYEIVDGNLEHVLGNLEHVLGNLEHVLGNLEHVLDFRVRVM